MTWNHPSCLIALWILPFLAFFLWHTWNQLRRREELFVDLPMVSRLFPPRSKGRTIGRGILIILSMAFLIISLAGPKFGVYFEKVSRKGADVLVLLDTSRSMLGEDLVPNRLEAAKLDIEDLLDVVEGDRVGLAVFAGKGAIRVPLTDDFGFFRDALKKVDTKSAPQGGTAIGDAIRLALHAMPPDAARDQSILLITDGEDHESMPLEAARNAAERNVRIFTVALGNRTEGARIPLYDKKGARTGYEKYEGQEVWTKPDEALLKEIAEITGGEFLPAGDGPCDLGAFYSSAFANLNRAGYEESEKRLLYERYQLFLALGLFCLIAWLAVPESGASLWRRNRDDSSLLNPKTLSLLFLLALIPGLSVLKAADDDSFFANDTQKFPTNRTPVPAETPEGFPLSENNSTLTIPEPMESSEQPSMTGEGPIDLPAEENPQEEPLNESPLLLYNRGCQCMENPAKDSEAESLFVEVLNQSHDPVLVPRAFFNLGVLKARSLAADVQRAREEAQKTASPSPKKDEKAAPRSPLEEYRKAIERHQEARQKVREQAQLAAEDFQQAAHSDEKRIKAESLQNLDLVRSWMTGQEARWRNEDAQIRDTLELPDRLKWMNEEIHTLLNQPCLRRGIESQEDIQKMSALSREILPVTQDLEILSQREQLRANTRDKDKNASDEVSLPDTQSLRNSLESMAQYEATETRNALRSASDEIDSARNQLLDYRPLLEEAASVQEKIVQKIQSSQKEKPSDLPDEPLWLDDAVARKSERIVSLADQYFQEQPWTDQDDRHREEFEAARNQPQDENAQAKPQTDAEFAQRLSMKLALEQGPEIGTILGKLTDPEDPSMGQEEERVLDILRNIMDPFRDPNQQNPDSQDQDQNSDSHQNQNSDQGNSDQNPEPKESQPPQDQSNPGDPQEEQQNQPQPKPEDQNADAAMRKVRQRQQKAENSRRLRDEYLRREDKPQKDW